MTHTCPAPAPAAAGVEDGDWGGVVEVAGAGDVAAGAALVPQVCTPPWPRQAPLRVVPLKAVPSLQVAVTGACAKVGAVRPKRTIREIANNGFMISYPCDRRGRVLRCVDGSSGSPDDRVVDHEHDDCADNCDQQAVEVKSSDTAGAND